MNRVVATLAVATTLSVATPNQCEKVDLTFNNGQDMRGDSNADYFLVALLYAWWGYCRAQANAMADLYYNPARGLNDNDRSKIQFVLVNDDGAARDFERLKQSGQYQGKYLPAYNDDSQSNLMNNISGGDPWPKDDMAILDKEGRMIGYFESSQSNMMNRSNNKIKAAVERVLSDDYKNPCEVDSSDSESGDESKDEEGIVMQKLCTSCDYDGASEDRVWAGVSLETCKSRCIESATCMAIDYGKNGRAGQCYLNFGGDGQSYENHDDFDAYVKETSEDESSDDEEEKSPLDELKATCMLEDNCSDCKGKLKKGACKLKKKLKCKFMGTEDLCKKAKCQYKPSKKNKKAKCKGKGIF